MNTLETMRQAGTCRRFRTDPVSDGTMWELFDTVRFAPSGGNRQPVRFIAVRDPVLKRPLRDLYLRAWRPHLDRLRSGAVTSAARERELVESDAYAHHLHEVPVLVVVCARMVDLHITDLELGRPSIVGGASVYPAVQNLLLACRERGLGAALSTLAIEHEDEIRGLLEVPSGFAVAAIVAVGWPAGPLPTRLRRRPVSEIAFVDRFGQPLREPRR